MNIQSDNKLGKGRIGSLALVLALVVFLPGPLRAHQGIKPPATAQVQPLAALPQLVLPATDVRAELAIDATAGRHGPLRYAVARPVSITPDTAGTWDQLPDGRLWRLRVVSPGATDLNFGFTTFSMPEGAMLYILSESDDYYQGPYTAEHNADHGQLWTPMVPGQAATIELFVPSTVASQPQLVLSQVSTGYRDLFNLQKDGSLPKGDTCEIDVTCPAGAGWANEIRSVANISIGGTGFCSATLVMDTSGDFRPFLLTANHCGINSGNAATVVAFWNYQSACGTHGTGVPNFPNTGSWAQNTSGSTFRAAKTDVDFCLIELSSIPDSSYNIFYSGWDRSGGVPGSGVGIHHPQAGGKCISFSAPGFTTVNSCIGTGGANTHWQVPWQNPPQGVTEPGSSGSGIFDAATHLVVGTLSGGPSACGATPANLHDCYGKLSVSWASGGTAATELKDWLDAANTGATAMAGANPPTVSNDHCPGAIALTLGNTFVEDTTWAGTFGDPVPTCRSAFGKSVWFTYTPPASGTVTISTCGSSFDTVLAVYTGSCGGLAEIACDDDNGPDCVGLQASVSFAGTAFTTYYIMAGGYASGSGSLHIKADLVNDQCAGAIPLLPGVAVTLDTTSATSGGDPIPSCSTGGLFGNGVWFTYTPTETAPVLVSACGSSFDTVVGVYTGTCGALAETACNDDHGPDCPGALQSSVVFNATAGTTYHILAGGYNSLTGILRIVAQLANDQCGGAVALTTGVPHTMSTADATSFGDPGPTCGSGVGKGVWFTYTAPGNGIVTLNTCGSSFDTVVQAYSGSCGALVSVGCDDDAGPGQCPGDQLNSFTEFPATSGTTYHILAGGYSGASGNLTIVANLATTTRTLTVNAFPNNVGIGFNPADTSSSNGGLTPYTATFVDGVTVTLYAPGGDGFNVFQKWQLDGADYSTSPTTTVAMGGNHTMLAVYVPPNDLCAGAVALTTAVPYNENTSGATSTGDPAASCGSGGGNGVWFTYTPSLNGIVTINACGSDYDTVLTAYSGICGGLAEIICNDDQGIGACPGNSLASFLEFPGTAGTTYHILAGGYFGSRGNLSIVANVFTGPLRTLTLQSLPNSGVSIFPEPTDTSGQSGANTPFTRTFIDGLVVTLFAASSDGFNVFQKWQIDGVDSGTSTSITVTMGANHTVTAVYGPPNDQCAGAIALATGVPYVENTTTATSTGDPSPVCQPTFGNGVWFTYTPSINGVVSIDTCGSDYDTVVQAYTGSCGALVPVAGGGCNDDSFGPCGYIRASFADFAATAGTTYYILAGGYLSHQGSLHILANVAPPVNLSVNSTPNSGVNISAVPPDIGANFGGPTPFARTYAAGTVVTLTAPGSDGFNLFEKWQLDGVDQPPGTTLSFAMNSGHNATAVYVSPNDQCAGAVALANGVPYNQSTTGATDVGDPILPYGHLHKGVWFTFTPAATEQVTISTCGSSFDTMIQVFEGACGALQRVPYGFDDDDGPSCVTLQASVAFSGTAGTVYRILVGGYNGDSGNLAITATSGLINDECSGSFVLRYGVPFTMTTVNSTTGGADPVPTCRNLFGKTVWFSFTSPITGNVPISTCGSDFDTVLQVFTGGCGALAPVVCDDDNGPYCGGLQASVTLNATAGTTYHVMVAGYSSLSGNLRIIAGTQPILTAVPSGANISLSWPTYYWPWYVLQEKTTDLGSPGGWNDVLPTPFGSVLVPITGPFEFFRLQTP